MASNARGRLSYTEDAREAAVQAMVDSLGSLYVPMPEFADGTSDHTLFFDPPTIELTRQVVCHEANHHEIRPTLENTLWEDMVSELQELGMVGGKSGHETQSDPTIASCTRPMNLFMHAAPYVHVYT